MERREFLKIVPAVALGAAGLVVTRSDAKGASAPAGKAAQQGSTAGQMRGVPDYAKDLLTSDMNGLGPDGKPTGQTMTFTGASQAGVTAETASKEMTLTREEQGILDGNEGEEKA